MWSECKENRILKCKTMIHPIRNSDFANLDRSRIIIYITLLSQIHAVKNKTQTTTITVHFLYGSKPAKKYKKAESKWFGGIHGGHVGIETDSNNILNFVPTGSIHIFHHKKEFHGGFRIHRHSNFWLMFGADSVKKCSITIPLTAEQKRTLDQKIRLEEERIRKHRESLDKVKFSENNVLNDILSETAKTSYLEREKAELNEKLIAGNVPYTEMNKMILRMEEVTKLLGEKEMRWLELSELAE